MFRTSARFEMVAAGVWATAIAFSMGAVSLSTLGSQRSAPPQILGMSVPADAQPQVRPENPTSLTWRLNNPMPSLIPEARANPVAVADKFAARVASMAERDALRAYEGAPPVIPHAIADLNVQTCRACHGQGLRAGDKTARMVSHTYLPNCTQCHVEAASPLLGGEPLPQNTFVGRRASGYGGTRAWTGAPPVIPHTLFMRTNCVSCHGEFGYSGWRPDHLSRTNCAQCHAPAAEFDQLSPCFSVPDMPDGLQMSQPR